MVKVDWIAVEERLPVEGVGVLLTDGFIVTAGELSGKNIAGDPTWSGHGFGGYEWEWCWFEGTRPTHWAMLPLPPAPQRLRNT